jgi:hypothetical protein
VKFRLYLTCLVAICGTHVFAQPKIQWLGKAVGPGLDNAVSIALSPRGEVLVAGNFSDTISISPTISNFSAGSYDGFIGRWQTDGAPKAVIAMGGAEFDDMGRHVVAPNGDIIATGVFSTEMEVGGEFITSPYEFQLDAFVVRMNSSGTVLWSRVFASSTADETAPYVALDSTGSIYVCGTFGGTLETGGPELQAQGASDTYVVKLGSTGAITWAKQFGNSGVNRAVDISTNRDGSRVTFGYTYRGSEIVNNLETPSLQNLEDIALRCLNSEGNEVWSMRIGSAAVDRKLALFTSPTGMVYAAGEIQGTGRVGARTLQSWGESRTDALIARITSEGEVAFAKAYGFEGAESANAIYADEKGAMYIGGTFTEVMDLGGDRFDAEGGTDGFLARFRSDGSYDWVIPFQGPFDDEVTDIAVTASNNPIVCGVFDTQMRVGDTTLMGERFTDVFVAGLLCGPNTRYRNTVDSIAICEGTDSTIAVPNNNTGYAWFANGQALSSSTSAALNLAILPVGTHQVYVQVTDEYGCTGTSKPLTVVVSPGAPVVTIDDRTIGGVVELFTAPLEVQFQWYRNDVLVPGKTSNVFTEPIDGLYKVLVTDSAGCSRFSESFPYSSTSVQEGDLATAIYPNPTQNIIQIAGYPFATVTLINMLGALEHQVQLGDSPSTISVWHLAPGSYTLVITHNNKVHYTTVVKQ